MDKITVTKRIDAPVDFVFDTVAEIDNFRKAIPRIDNIELLSDVESGVGTRFRETRIMRGKEVSTVLEITQYEKNRSVRLVADSHGTVWDTIFYTTPAATGTTLEMYMDALPSNIIARVMNFLMKGFIHRAVEQDMDAVKSYCESQTSAVGSSA